MTRPPKSTGRQQHPALPDMVPAARTRSFWLNFDEEAAGSPKKLDKLRKNLSAIETDGNAIWVASDEYACLDKLKLTRGGQTFAEHKRFPLKRTFRLAGDTKPCEADLEGLSRDGRRLWLLGSHCRTRAQPEPASEASTPASPALDAPELRPRQAVN
jgi:hypothetical protein